ncbi:MAG: NAD-dependent epimerase/dehydratase family protein [Promethearchaeati archaeon SRVP18_Atabeyarchaeia-1]
MKRFLVIGSSGQIGSDLVPVLRGKYGIGNVLEADIKEPTFLHEEDLFIHFDALDQEALADIVREHEIDAIYHMASILSATGEKVPQTAWNLNMNSLINVLEVGRKHGVERIVWPSSIAAFGPSTPRENTPNDTILRPTTMYGITKVTGELLVEYYFKKYGLDTRSVRLPGIISSETPPGGGTTDYAVEIFYEAIRKRRYTCFVKEKTMLPMMYMPDCIKCLIDLAEADGSKLEHRVFNVAGMSFTAGELTAEIKKHIPEFKIDYRPDFRQDIADSWPRSIDDSIAREEWGWKPSYDLASMTEDMIKKLSKKLK